MRKIGILGGTFDPIHNGHLDLAKKSYESLCLDQVILVPSHISYQKENVSDSYHRYEMTLLAAQAYDWLTVSDIELQRGGNSYTYETIQYFRDQMQDTQIYFIMGEDSLISLPTWMNVGIMLSNCILAIATRDTDTTTLALRNESYQWLDSLGASYVFVTMQPIDISSSILREQIDSDFFLQKWIPEKVLEYMKVHSLYDPDMLKIISYMKEHLSQKRYRHSVSVAKVAEKLAIRHSQDIKMAYLAGMMHDIGKGLSEKELVLYCQSKQALQQYQHVHPKVLHAFVGANLAEEMFAVNNQEILNAIRWHTTGRPQMSALEMIIYIADYIEPLRPILPNIESLREMAYQSLEQTVYCIARDTILHLQTKEEPYEPYTLETLRYYETWNS